MAIKTWELNYNLKNMWRKSITLISIFILVLVIIGVIFLTNSHEEKIILDKIEKNNTIEPWL